MAAHITCQNSDILPNTFPSPRPKAKDHGVISEYETPFVMQRKHIFASEVAGGPCIDTEEYPILKKPIPVSSQSFDFNLDPALCVTPEKPKRTLKTVQRLKSDITEISPPSERSVKVRFDKTVEVKELTPETDTKRKQSKVSGSSFQTIDSSATTSLPYVNIQHAAREGRILQPLHKCEQGRDSGYSARDLDSDFGPKNYQYDHDEVVETNEGSFMDTTDTNTPISVLASDLASLPRTSISPSFQMDKVNTQSSDDSESAEELRQIIGDEEHVLARPEFNSTLRVSKEMKQLKATEIDLCAAVEQKLKTSEKTKGMLLEKVTSKVNTKWESQMFNDLVSVEVTVVDPVVSSERAFKAQRIPQKPSPANGTQVQEPDILDFYSADLQKEIADYTLVGLPSLDEGPQTADLARAFDVYKHVRVWEKW